MKFGQTSYAVKSSPWAFQAPTIRILSFIILLLLLDSLFSQAIPAPYSLDPIQLCGASLGAFSNLEYFLSENEYKRSLYSPFDFENNFFATPSFITWRLEYYKSQRHRILICKEILVANLPDVSLQKRIASSKTKGIHVREILHFEHFLKVKYNLRATLRVVWEAMEVFK